MIAKTLGPVPPVAPVPRLTLDEVPEPTPEPSSDDPSIVEATTEEDPVNDEIAFGISRASAETRLTEKEDEEADDLYDSVDVKASLAMGQPEPKGDSTEATIVEVPVEVPVALGISPRDVIFTYFQKKCRRRSESRKNLYFRNLGI